LDETYLAEKRDFSKFDEQKINNKVDEYLLRKQKCQNMFKIHIYCF